MALFDFLKSKINPQAGRQVQGVFGTNAAGNAAMAPQLADPGMLQMAPTMGPKEPGFLGRMMAPDKDGIGGRDRLLMAAMALGGNGADALAYRQTLKKEYQTKEERQRKNEAFKAAYGEDGRFDPGKYIEALGDAGDATDAAVFHKAFAPNRKTVANSQGIWQVDDETGQLKEIERFPQKADDPLQQQLLTAQILALQAQAKQRGAQGDYYGAKARQPYAPQRAKAGAAMPPPPPGFRPVR